MDWEPEQYKPDSFRATPVQRPGPNWRAIFTILMVLIVLLSLAVWRFSGNDDSETTTVDTSDNSEDDDDEGTSDALNSEGDAGADGTSTTTTETTTTVAITTTTFTVVVPPDADEYGPTTINEQSSVSTVGLDSVIFGMTVRQAQSAAGTLLIPIAPVSDCYHVVPHNAPEGIVFVVHSNTIERVDINSGPITTRSGIGIGTPDETVISLFGDSIERSVRTDGTIDLIFVPSDVADAEFRVVFNVADGKVRALKSGRLPIVLSDTGCDAP